MVKNSSTMQEPRRCRFDPWVKKVSWRRAWQPTTAFLPGEFQGQKNLEGYRAWGPKESDATEQLSLYFQNRPIDGAIAVCNALEKPKKTKYRTRQKTLLNSQREGNVILFSLLFELQSSLALSH